MAHNVHHSIYDENVKKEMVQAEWDEYAANEDWQEGCSGLSQKIRWIDHVCDNIEEAYDFIEKNDSGWYDQLAVKFKDAIELESSKTRKALSEKEKILLAKYNQLEYKVHYKGVKSAFITCKSCGSKIASQFFGNTVRNHCPVCNNDLRPQSTLDAIKKALEKLEKVSKEIDEEIKKDIKRARKNAIKWLVKIEYHT